MNLLYTSKEKINKVLKSNFRRMKEPEYYYGVDNNQDRAGGFTEDRLKVLVIFLSTGKSRALSNTFSALDYLVHERLGDKAFVDCCYFPEKENKKIFKDNNIPYVFGNVSHMPISAYDLVMVSAAILPEVVNVPQMLAESGVPLTVQERDKNDDIPLILFGGAIANELSILYGDVYDRGEKLGNSVIDIANYGYGENTIPEFCEYLYSQKNKGINIKNKPLIKNMLIDDAVLHDYLFYPEYYKWIYERDNFTIKEIRCLDSRLPKRVQYSRVTSGDMPGFPKKIFNLSGENPYSQDVMVSSGCAGQGSTCSFCVEGSVSGYYRERPLETIRDDMEYIRSHNAVDSISYYSYNLNYFSRFMDLIAESAIMFRSMNLLNERIDVVANAPDQIKIAKHLGLRRFAGALEGIDDRIRNKIYNKNLDRETLMKAMRVIFSQQLMHFKTGLIWCGLETDEDIDEFISELDEMIAIRDEVGAKTSIQVNVTPLIIYSQIALRYMPRYSAEDDFNTALTMDRLMKECWKRNVRIKLYCRGCLTWASQLFLDFGPAGTDWLVNASVKDGVSYYTFLSKIDKQKFVKGLKDRGYSNPLFFTKERPLDWIFPNDHIKYVEDRLIALWKQRHIKQDFSTDLCLRTLANDMASCQGCGLCKDKDEIQQLTNRKLEDKYNLDDIIECLESSRHVMSVRIVVKIKPEWGFYNREGLTRYITAQFLKRDSGLAEAFYSVGENTLTWVSNNCQKAWIGGIFAFDILLKQRISVSRLKNLVDGVNEILESCYITKIYGDVKSSPLSKTTKVAYLGRTDKWSITELKDCLLSYSWQVPVSYKSKGYALSYKEVYQPELRDSICMMQKGKDSLLYMVLPANVNPYLLWSVVIGKTHNRALKDFEFNVQDHVKEEGIVCRCGRHLEFSLLTGQVNTLCSVCRGKLMLSKMK